MLALVFPSWCPCAGCSAFGSHAFRLSGTSARMSLSSLWPLTYYVSPVCVISSAFVHLVSFPPRLCLLCLVPSPPCLCHLCYAQRFIIVLLVGVDCVHLWFLHSSFPPVLVPVCSLPNILHGARSCVCVSPVCYVRRVRPAPSSVCPQCYGRSGIIVSFDCTLWLAFVLSSCLSVPPNVLHPLVSVCHLCYAQ